MPRPLSCRIEVGEQRRDVDDRHQHAERLAAVLADEEVHLRVEPVLRAVAPDRGQQEVGHRERERAVAEDVERRRAAPVRPAAAAEERERGVDLARHEQEHEHRAEAAAADGPLLEVHGAPAPRHHAEREREGEERAEDEERRAHSGRSCRGGRLSARASARRGGLVPRVECRDRGHHGGGEQHAAHDPEQQERQPEHVAVDVVRERHAHQQAQRGQQREQTVRAPAAHREAPLRYMSRPIMRAQTSTAARRLPACFTPRGHSGDTAAPWDESSKPARPRCSRAGTRCRRRSRASARKSRSP